MNEYHLGHGVGEDDTYCLVSLANVLSGAVPRDEHTDDLDRSHICPVIGRFAIGINDELPIALLDTPEWRERAARLSHTRASAAVTARRVEYLLVWLETVVVPFAMRQAYTATQDDRLTPYLNSVPRHVFNAARDAAQIGRASCRERV